MKYMGNLLFIKIKYMKNLICIITTCALSCGMFSCSENQLMDEEQPMRTKSMIADNSRYHITESGAISFNSVNDYFALTDSLVKLSNDEFRRWEAINSFTSYETVTSGIIEQIENAQNENNKEEVSDLLNKYANVVYLDVDSLVKPIIKSRTYRNIANQDGVFFLKDVKNIVDGKYVSTENEGGARNASTKISYLVSEDNKTRAGELIQYAKREHYKSDDTKKVMSDCFLVKSVVFEDAQGGNSTMLQFHIWVDGKTHKPAGWKDYSTGYYVEKISAIFNQIPKSVHENGTLKETQTLFFEHPGRQAAGEGINACFIYNLGITVKNLTNNLQNATCIHYKAMTWGTDPEGVGYNYYNGGYDVECPMHALIKSGK